MIKKIALAALAASFAGAALAQNQVPLKVRSNGFITEAIGEFTGTCFLVVENETKYDAEVYLDGDFVGEADGYGSASGWVRAGYRKLYAECPGNDSHWGPRWVTLKSYGDFTWTLNY